MAFDDGIKTVSGSIAHTDDAAAKVPFVSVKCGIAPTLTGVTEIDVVRPDGNILQTVAESKEQNGVTWTVNSDGSITLSGKSTARTYLYVHLYHKILPKDATLTVSVEGLYDNGASDVFLNLPYSDNGTTYSGTYGQITWGSPKKTISYTADKYLGFLLDCPANVTTNQTVKIMVTIGSDAKAFEPYVAPVTYNVELGRTIYGGTADIVNGGGTADRLRYDLDENDTWGVYSGADHSFWHNVATGEDRPIDVTKLMESICNHLTVSSAPIASAPDFTFGIQGGQRIVVTADSSINTLDKFKTWLETHPLEFVVASATPTDFTFTPITPTPETVGKVNNVYCNTGDTEVTYHDNAHGFAEVTVNKTGKNLIYPKYSGRSSSGITYVVNSDHSVTCSGISTNTSWAAANLTTKPEFMQLIPKGTYFLTGGISSDIQIYLSGVYVDDGTAITQRADTGSGATYTFEKSVLVYPQIRIASGVDLTTPVTIRFQLELGSQASSYEPYEAVSKTAYLHKVIYGGQADVIRGTCEPKNLIKVPYYASSGSVSGGITYTYDNMGRVTCNGENTGTGNSVFYLEKGVYIQNYPSGTYYFSQEGFPYQSGTASTVQLTICSKLDSTVTQRIQLYSNTTGKSFTVSDNEYINDIFIRIASGKSADFTVNIQLEKGGTGTDFSPYFTPFSFTPISMETDEGENTLFSNEGTSAITYRKAVD